EELDEVVITGEAIDQNVESVEMSVAKLDIKTIEKIPAFAGEVDIIKSIQLLPGVSTVGEGASGFNVRGGGVGQNLVLLDEAPVYQSSHMFGFFSVFNPDAVKDVKLFKGGIPSRYGGRLSSILDIRMKEGNAKRVEVNGGVGTVFSRLAVEGPLKKDKSSFIIAARRSYADVVAKLVTDALQDGMGLYFYDLTAKTNFNINDKNRIYLSGYFGRDVFKFDKNQGFDWGNKTATFRWNHLYGSKLFSNYTLFYSNYDYGFEFGENAQDKFIWKSNIKTGNFKPEFTYFINSKNELTFGGEAILYRFEPANSESISGGISTNISVENRRAVETAVYIGNDQKMNENLTFQYGLRYSTFTYIGGSVYAYGDILPGIKKPLLSVSQKGDWEPIKSFGNIEPRASFRWKVSNTSSIKGSYNRMNQYIHLISNTTASIPIDIWQPSTNNIDPQQGNQVALGYFKNLKENAYETSAEVYYKWNENQIDYIDGADLFINPFLESQLLSGIGRAYGLEFYMAKKTGKLNGWVSYTLGKTEMKVDGINYGNDKENRTGNWYPTRFDQRHNLKIASFYDLNKRVSFSANFSYLSGTPTTFPTDRITIQDYVIPYIKGSLRNNVRIPDYHRLDLSVTINNVWRGKKGRKGSDYLVLSVYNLYGRKNPFSIYFSQGNDRQLSVDPVNTSATQLSIIGSVIPAISYNFKF
ncbi:MAG: TonB-dependent receptor plug domain-containing protein, partial [Cyclobacteriaceae bacterium]|nr:TonB-dependent receptor plug domain-containing protein [Cyclobacteriaceae bacterium]